MDGESSYAARSASSWRDPESEDGARLSAAIGLERVARLHDVLLRDAIRATSNEIQTLEDFKLLALIRRTPYGINQAEASETLMVSRPATSERVDRLANKGLIQRSSGADRRSVILMSTDKGIAATEQTYQRVSAAHDELLAGLSKRDIKSLVRIADKIESSRLGNSD